MAGGRPKKYNSVEELEKDIEKYFKYCDKNKKPYTISGLAYNLDIDRKTLLNYSKDEEFFPPIKKAKLKIESQLEECLYRLGNNSGVIFNLKNNYGWKDTNDDENTNTKNGVMEELVEALKNVKKD